MWSADTPQVTPTRRRLLAAAAGALLLAGCGFQPRHYVGLSNRAILFRFEKAAQLEPLLNELLAGQSVRRVTRVEEAEAIVTLGPLVERREILSLSGRGQVREYGLRALLTVRATDRAGNEIIAPLQLASERDYGYDESLVTPRAEEEQLLFHDMRRELLRRALLLLDRRLAAR
jgi:outer membrane lipopolysaccharide assembly protein LptE/RlpB